MNTNYVNDVSHLYEQPVKTTKEGKFECPVCEKSYATRAGIFRHMKEQDCAPPKMLFKDTVTENVGYEFFINTVCEFNKNQRSGMTNFRRSKYYKQALFTTLHCMRNKVDSTLFFEWVRLKKSPKYYNHALSLMNKDTSLVDFRNHLIQNEELIDSDAFYEQNEEELLKNTAFLVRALERGDIGLDYCLDHPKIDLGSRIDSLPEATRIHLLKVVSIKES